jgi:hypothetical protein
MLRKRTKAGAKHLEDMTPEELLSAYGFSDPTFMHSAQRMAQREALTRHRRIGQCVRAIRRTRTSNHEDA